MRVLIVRLSSLGDLIHTLPALSDAANRINSIRFDWVVEPGFQEIPKWHPSVDLVIPIAQRQWRHAPLKAILKGEIWQAFKNLRLHQYDLIIDAQGLVKSGIITRLARGLKVGYDKSSAREPMASYFYDKKIEVPSRRLLHAVKRTRQLFAGALGYEVPNTEPDYGINGPVIPAKARELPFILFFHGTTWETKYWPESHWIRLAEMVLAAGYQVYLPWGNALEKDRAQRIKKGCGGVQVLEHRLSLTEIRALMSKAQGIVAVDTGLGHLAAALGIPTVSLYGPTDPKDIGTLGVGQIHLTPPKFVSCAPCLSKQCHIASENRMNNQPPCLQNITPEAVWQVLGNSLNDTNAQ